MVQARVEEWLLVQRLGSSGCSVANIKKALYNSCQVGPSEPDVHGTSACARPDVVLRFGAPPT